jgi:hypothetical protein
MEGTQGAVCVRGYVMHHSFDDGRAGCLGRKVEQWP